MTWLYQLAMRAYPTSYRTDHGDELISTALELHDGNVSFREAASLTSNGLRQRVLDTTNASPLATWRHAARLAIWFSFLTWLTFRLLNGWQVVRASGDYAGQQRTRIGDVDIMFPTFHRAVDVLPGDGGFLLAIAAVLVLATAAALLVRVGGLTLGLAALAGLVPSLIVATTTGDVLIYVSHMAAASWFVVRGEHRRVLSAPLLRVFGGATAIFAVYLDPRSPLFEHVWGVGLMVAMGFGWALFTLAGILLVAHDPRILPICASVYAISLLQIALPAIGDDEAITTAPWTAVLIQAAVLLVVAVLASLWGNTRVRRV